MIIGVRLVVGVGLVRVGVGPISWLSLVLGIDGVGRVRRRNVSSLLPSPTDKNNKDNNASEATDRAKDNADNRSSGQGVVVIVAAGGIGRAVAQVVTAVVVAVA